MLDVAGLGASFSDLALSEVKPELALDATLMPRHMPAASIGVELGLRYFSTSQGPWTLMTARVAVHY